MKASQDTSPGETQNRILSEKNSTCLSQYLTLLDIAKRSAHKCAIELENIIKPYVFDYKSSDADPVSNADRIGEATIIKLIEDERPDDGILGEEGGNKHSISGLRWVIDSLDGTVNYLYSIPHWAISVACEQLRDNIWHTIVAVVYDVKRGEMFHAVHGGGAYMNDAAIYVNTTEQLDNAIIATEFSYLSKSRFTQAQVLVDVLPHVRDIRSLGSSALDLCWVALGRFDCFYENELSPWDWSAASLIVKEAGGVVTGLGTGVVAGNQALQASLYSLVRQR